ncbi:MAG TPA: hypothetical protein P5179_05140 [Candidatus Latescibacteria bacterium]|nr:hypothetical protein [Candidatus Latescibacterota bacterium]
MILTEFTLPDAMYSVVNSVYEIVLRAREPAMVLQKTTARRRSRITMVTVRPAVQGWRKRRRFRGETLFLNLRACGVGFSGLRCSRNSASPLTADGRAD